MLDASRWRARHRPTGVRDEGDPRSRRHRRSRHRGGAGVLPRRARPRGRRRRGCRRRSACVRISCRSGDATLELLEGTAADSAITKYVEKRGPGLHHITLRVDDIGAALAQLKARGVRLIDEQPRPGAEGALVAFIHPSSAHGVLVELKQERRRRSPSASAAVPRRRPARPVSHRTPAPSGSLAIRLGELELISLYDGYFGLDGGSMFGVVPRPLWSAVVAPTIATGFRWRCGRCWCAACARCSSTPAWATRKTRSLPTSTRSIGRSTSTMRWRRLASRPRISTSCSPPTCTSITPADSRCVTRAGRVRPRFPRARYVVRRGEWEDATHPHERNRASYLADNFRAAGGGRRAVPGRRRSDHHAGSAGRARRRDTPRIIR